MATRAPRTAMPGKEHLTLTGIMAVSDEFGRVRVILVDRLSGEKTDYSWWTLCRAVPSSHSEYRPPYRIHKADMDGVRGEFWAVPPARHLEYWLQVAEALRGREVTVEVTPRQFSLATRCGRVSGVSLDLVSLSPLGPLKRQQN